MYPRSGFWGPGISKIISKFICLGSVAGKDFLEEISVYGEHLPHTAVQIGGVL